MTEMVDSREYIAGTFLSISLGIFAGGLVVSNLSIHEGYFTTLATIQTSLLGIIVAIYTLSNQIATESYSTRILEILGEDNSYEVVLSLFGISVLTDIFSVLFLNRLQTYSAVSIAVFISTTLASMSFLSLYTVHNELIQRVRPKSISDLIEQRITKKRLLEESGTDGNKAPFFEYFEATRVAVSSHDRQASQEIAIALGNSIESVLSDILTDSTIDDEYVGQSSIKVLREYETILTIVIESKNRFLTSFGLKRVQSIVLDALDSGYDNIASTGSDIIIKGSGEIVLFEIQEFLVKEAWHVHADILEAAAEGNHPLTLNTCTNGISLMIMDLIEQEEENEIGSFNIRIINTLTRSFLIAWKTYFTSNITDESTDILLYGDSEFMNPIIWDENINYFDDNYTTFGGFITSLANNSGTLTANMMLVQKTIMDGFTEIAIEAVEKQNLEFSIHYSMLVIIAGLAFPDRAGTIGETVAKLEVIADTDGLGEQAVDSALDLLDDYESLLGTSLSPHLGLLFTKYMDNMEQYEEDISKVKNQYES